MESAVTQFMPSSRVPFLVLLKGFQGRLPLFSLLRKRKMNMNSTNFFPPHTFSLITYDACTSKLKINSVQIFTEVSMAATCSVKVTRNGQKVEKSVGKI